MPDLPTPQVHPMTAKPLPCPFCGCGTCKHDNLGYREWHEDAAQRAKRGERQRRCPECGLYCWPHELPDEAIERWNRRAPQEER